MEAPKTLQEEAKCAAAPETAAETTQEVLLCLVAKTRFRALLEANKRALKKGKNRKLSKKDKEEIEDELTMLTFSPAHFARQVLEQDAVRRIRMEGGPEEEMDLGASRSGIAMESAEKVLN